MAEDSAEQTKEPFARRQGNPSIDSKELSVAITFAWFEHTALVHTNQWDFHDLTELNTGNNRM